MPKEKLLWLFDSADVTSQYAGFQQFWGEAEQQGRGHRLPFDEMIRNPLVTTEVNRQEVKAARSPSLLSHYSKAGAYFISALPGSLRKKAISYADKKGLIPVTASPAMIATQAELTIEERNEAMMKAVAQKIKGRLLISRSAKMTLFSQRGLTGMNVRSSKSSKLSNKSGLSIRRLSTI